MNDPLIHIPLYLDEWHARLSGYDYLQRGAFITLFIAYVKSSGELNFEGNNSALFRACGAITDDEQKSLLEIYKEVKLFADPRIMKQVEVRETRRKNAQLGGIAKGLANAKPNAKILAEQKVSKRSAKSELELESDSERELKEEKDTIVSKKKDKPSGLLPVYFQFMILGLTPDKAIVKAEKFYSHYQSNGWKVSRNPMKDWKAATSGTWCDFIKVVGYQKDHLEYIVNELEKQYADRKEHDQFDFAKLKHSNPELFNDPEMFNDAWNKYLEGMNDR